MLRLTSGGGIATIEIAIASSRSNDDYRVREGYRYSPRANDWRQERREAFARGYYDRFGCWHRY